MSGHPSKYRAKVTAQGRDTVEMRSLDQLRDDQKAGYVPDVVTAPKLGRRRSRRGRATVESR